MEVIQSVQNPKVKLWYQLRNKKGREQNDLYIIEGVKLVEEAIRSDHIIDKIIYDIEKGFPQELNNLLSDNTKNSKIIPVSNHVINKLSETESPQGVLAIVRKKEWQIEQLISNGLNFYVILDEIQDPGNLGTLIRSADAAGVKGIILGNGTVELHNPKVIRSAMGSIFHLPILTANLDKIIPKLNDNGIKIVGTSPYANKSYYEVNLADNVAIMIGNEAKGLSDSRKMQVDDMVKIPLKGQAESLNAAMAATVILFEHVRQLEMAQKKF